MKKKQKLVVPTGPPPRVVREGGGNNWCNNCHSTMTRIGFLGLYGKFSCDNPKCTNHIK